MDTARNMMVELSNQECLTGSFNGPALIETLRSLTPAEAASTDTYEGYSAWTVALHVLYYKYLIAKELGAVLPPYDYEKKDFPAPPAEITQAAWDKVISDIEATHNGFIQAFAEVPDEKFQEIYAPFKTPYGKAVAWVVCHDTNHNTQIRNMGLPSLRKPID